MTTTKTNPIWELVEDLIADELENRDRDEESGIKASCEILMEEIQDYIKSMKEQETYSDDPYVYNGVSRSDFF